MKPPWPLLFLQTIYINVRNGLQSELETLLHIITSRTSLWKLFGVSECPRQLTQMSSFVAVKLRKCNKFPQSAFQRITLQCGGRGRNSKNARQFNQCWRFLGYFGELPRFECLQEIRSFFIFDVTLHTIPKCVNEQQ